MPPRVSVLLAVHNGAKSLAGALESLTAQTFRDFDVVLVDDGSTDATASILRAAAARDSRFHVLSNASRMGLAASLNRAFAHATGELVARLDADDSALPQRLGAQVAFLDAHPDVAILGSAAFVHDDAGNELGVRSMPEKHEQLFARRLLYNAVMHPTVMMRRVVLERLGGYDPALQRAQDYDLWMRAFRAGYRFHNIPEPLIRYRIGPPTWRSIRYGAWLMHRWAWRERRFVAAVIFPVLFTMAAIKQVIGRSSAKQPFPGPII